jgi:hypothetical protein
MPWGELTMKNEACGRKNWMMAAWGGGGGPVRGGVTQREMRGGPVGRRQCHAVMQSECRGDTHWGV